MFKVGSSCMWPFVIIGLETKKSILTFELICPQYIAWPMLLNLEMYIKIALYAFNFFLKTLTKILFSFTINNVIFQMGL